MPEHDDKTHSHAVLTQGTEVQHYRIVEKIGAGGMGEVYLADDTKLKRQVALKFLPGHLAADSTVRTRFVREAQTLAKLNHPNIVSVYDVSDFAGRPFYVMELVQGESLHHYCHDEPLPFDLIIEYAIQICQGLGEAHRAGIIHRDIKSANIAVDRKERIRLLDFGLAAREGDDRITRTGSTLGTVSYMSPEQISGRDVDHRSDLFSLGIVLYELIAGRTPFKRDSEGATLKSIIEDTPEPLTRYKSDVPERLQDIVMKLLDKDKELRYQSAEGVIADLKRLVYDSQPTGRVRSVESKSSRRSWIFGVAAAVIVVAAAVILMFASSKKSPGSDERGIPMIAVLPFENLGSPDDEYFADGMTAEITSRLTGIKGLGVISRPSAMKYKHSDKSRSQIGVELGVDYILEGTVRWSKVGESVRVRITPQLVRANDERQLWGDNYQRDLLEVFSVQAEIAAQIVDQLGMKLLDSDRETRAARPTENAQAYEYYLKGLTRMQGIEGDRSGMFSANAAFDTAVMFDPDFALAHAMRSIAYSRTAVRRDIRRGADQALESANRALELDPDLPQAHVALGTYYNAVLNDYERALEQFKLARSEIHSDPDVLAGIAIVHLRQGKFEESHREFRKAVELDPLSPVRYWLLAQSYQADHRFEEAEQNMSRAIALAPTNASYYFQLAKLLAARYGVWAPIDSLTREALTHCDSVEFASQAWHLVNRLPDIDLRKLVYTYQKTYKQWTDTGHYFVTLGRGYAQLGDSAMSLVYFDSSRQQYEKRIKESPDDPLIASILGSILARLGKCDRAVEFGRRSKELLSVDKCHW
jgi:serine/threonine protein kinase/tetratricopeptide (TPR) repeat protein